MFAAEARDWSSATFTGARHRIEAEADGCGWPDGLEEAEFDLLGHVVVDLAVVARSAGRATIEVLTVEEW